MGFCVFKIYNNIIFFFFNPWCDKVFMITLEKSYLFFYSIKKIKSGWFINAFHVYALVKHVNSTNSYIFPGPQTITHSINMSHEQTNTTNQLYGFWMDILYWYHIPTGVNPPPPPCLDSILLIPTYFSIQNLNIYESTLIPR